MSAVRTFVDTNILAYVFDDSEPTKRDAARARLKSEQATRELVVSTQVLQELYVALTRGKRPIASPEIAEHAVHEASRFSIVQVDVRLLHAAIAESRQHRVSFWDALVIRAAIESNCQVLLTEDLTDGQLFNGVRVENPFSKL